MKYAGFWRRFAAIFLDSLIMNVLALLIYSLLSSALRGNSVVSVLYYTINTVLYVGYFTWYQSKTTQTLGKKVMGIRVVDAQGKTPNMLTFFLREVVGKLVSGIILGIGYLIVLWDGRKQALHDKIASTYVVRV
ncbi:MAG: hypothetical protein A2782_01450 [Candidatus Blackburnbacteria bacterium RIFCSPHIGHO2_01_FULL_43_15b]|uniref:RDD domain-containing protein n=1 Tax=Candidatus Blackburnbacteria bacterium RIFCSPHIGHO2_01_FULL_43_15b TaxID=1797513 RepID=A0A1G1UXB9_9BACT|nr:MAG: hypothetical protein A2782_01450 [Candidatus Blackburnbacteria bacterium RIFCSPHIGHO2_01_FULL_43_15b]